MVSSPTVPMPSAPPPPPPILGGKNGEKVDAVDAYGIPVGSNPSGFASPPPRMGNCKSGNGQKPHNSEPSTTSSRTTQIKSSSPFFKSCFGGESSVPLSSRQKKNILYQPQKTINQKYGAIKLQDPEEDYGESSASRSFDQQLNPNLRRVANSAEGEGTALPELILQMRIINITLCTTALILEVPFWIGRAVMLNMSELVLGVSLSFFALLLCCWDMHIPLLSDAIKDNFGIIYHPYGRASFFIMMAGLCIGQGGLIEQILGCVIILNALYTIYVPCRYPHYEKAFADYGEVDVRGIAAQVSARRQGKAWADPRIVEEEKRSLIAKYSSASGE